MKCHAHTIVLYTFLMHLSGRHLQHYKNVVTDIKVMENLIKLHCLP